VTHLPNWNGPNRNEPGRNSDVRGATQRQRRIEAAQDAEGRIEDPRGRTRGRATLESRPFGGFRRSLGGSSTSTPFELRGNLDPPPPAVKHHAPRTHPRPPKTTLARPEGRASTQANWRVLNRITSVRQWRRHPRGRPLPSLRLPSRHARGRSEERRRPGPWLL
jgi:hypothetical protein